ncbi:MAG: DUF3168 domain-containing protein [Abyssibacter sp.]|uniref:tail completion protein gp17 n=1 Tax=Abyssibacter sp. TaxID=2320200 RepID=UPI00321C36F3
MIQGAIRALALKSAAVRDIAGARKWFHKFASEATPGAYVVFQRVGTPRRDMHHNGPSCLVQSRVQIDCYAPEDITAARLATAVRKQLNGFPLPGVANTVTHGGKQTRIGLIQLDNELDGLHQAVDLHRVTLDFTVWHYED